MFSDECSDNEKYERVREEKYKFDPVFTNGAQQFVDIRKNEKRVDGHINYRIFDEGYENSQNDIFG
jgi:hypothetical protein